MTKCPRCFTALPARRVVWQCVSGQCRREFDPRGSAFAGVPMDQAPLMEAEAPEDAKRWSPPAAEEMTCYQCGGRGLEVCPTCHYFLPPSWRLADAFCVALAGARATGKSVYLGVLIKQLSETLAVRGGSLSFPPGPSREIYQTHYEKPLFEARGIMNTTVPTNVADAYQRDPLICSLGVVGDTQRYLVFRDAAGEDLEGLTGLPEHLSYFNRADAVFYLFDPTAVPEVRDLLRDLLPPQVHQVGDPIRALDSVIQLTRDSNARVAMIMSKFDTMQALRHVRSTNWSRVMSNPGAAFARDPGTHVGYQADDAALLHEEVRSLLELLGARRFVTAMSSPAHGRPYRHRFFAVSALGEPAEGERLHKRGIASFRCLDPLRWATAERGIF